MKALNKSYYFSFLIMIYLVPTNSVLLRPQSPSTRASLHSSPPAPWGSSPLTLDPSWSAPSSSHLDSSKENPRSCSSWQPALHVPSRHLPRPLSRWMSIQFLSWTVALWLVLCVTRYLIRVVSDSQRTKKHNKIGKKVVVSIFLSTEIEKLIWYGSKYGSSSLTSMTERNSWFVACLVVLWSKKHTFQAWEPVLW